MNTVSLSSLRPGMDCRLQEIKLFGGMRRRLQDLGFQKNVMLHCAFRAPSGSPVAFVCRGTLLALRQEDCDKIVVIPVA